MNYGIQLYSLRDITKDDFAGALRTVAELGYTSVEPAGFFGTTAEDFNRLLAENGLTISSTHTGVPALLPEKLETTIAFHRAIGNPCIIIPGADLSTPEKLEEFIALVNDVQPKLAAAGIRLAYHNHAREFQKNDWGILTHSVLEARTNLEFEIDTYWAYVAGVDPVETITRLRDRVRLIHLKDGDAEGHGCALGEGTAPVAAVRARAIELGLGMVVESEGCQPTGAEEVGRCIAYLRKLDAE